MPAPVNVRSVAAIADFRAALATFGETATKALDEVDMELGRAIEWVSDEQPAFWKSEVQRSLDAVADRRNELDACEKRAYDGQRPTCYQERKALEAAKRYVRYCEDKVDVIRRWSRTVHQEIAEYGADVSKFRGQLMAELPKSLALLARMVSALEGYAAIPVVSATPVGQPLSESIARTAEEAEPRVAVSVFQQLREHTPDLETRQTIEPRQSPVDQRHQRRDDSGELESADETTCEQAALETAHDLRLEPSFPGWDDKVVLLAGALEQAQVYLERMEAPDGDSGWFIGPLAPKLGVEPEYEAKTMREIAQLRPALINALALPAEFLAVFSGDELVAVVNSDGRDLWTVQTDDAA